MQGGFVGGREPFDPNPSATDSQLRPLRLRVNYPNTNKNIIFCKITLLFHKNNTPTGGEWVKNRLPLSQYNIPCPLGPCAVAEADQQWPTWRKGPCAQRETTIKILADFQ